MAGDMVILGKTPEVLQYHLGLLYIYCSNWGLEVNAEKMVLRNGGVYFVKKTGQIRDSFKGKNLLSGEYFRLFPYDTESLFRHLFHLTDSQSLKHLYH